MEDLLEEGVILEIVFSARDVHESARREKSFLKIHKPDAPRSALDRLTAMTTLCLAARRSLAPIDSRKATVRQTLTGHLFQAGAVGDILRRFSDRLQQLFRTLVGGTGQMKPQRQVSIREWIRKTFAKAELAAGNLLPAAPAFRAAA